MTNEQAIEQIRNETDQDKRNDLMVELFDQNNGLVMMLYNRYFRGIILLDDYRQEAYLAFDRAVKTYNPSTAMFSSWLTRNIYFLVTSYIRDTKAIVRVPRYVWSQVKDMDEEERHLALQAVNQRSLDEQVGDESDSVPLIDIIPDLTDKINECIDSADNDALKQLFTVAISELPKRSADIILRRFYDNKTLEEIGIDYRLSRERVRQIEVQAIGALKRGKYARHLKSFLS